jgi:hypothetical protein
VLDPDWNQDNQFVVIHSSSIDEKFTTSMSDTVVDTTDVVEPPPYSLERHEKIDCQIEKTDTLYEGVSYNTSDDGKVWCSIVLILLLALSCPFDAHISCSEVDKNS